MINNNNYVIKIIQHPDLSKINNYNSKSRKNARFLQLFDK